MIALISKNRPIWIITVGFILVITTLTVMALVGLQEVESIRKKAAMLAKEHLFTAKLVDSLEQEQQRAGAILVGTIRVNSDSQSRLRILAELDSFDQRLPLLIQEGKHSLPSAIWLDLEDSAKAYSREVRQALESKNATKPNVDLLEFRYEKLVHLLGQIIK
ncbi:MAG: hypothetical protein JNN15_16210, partial [Blastocatellia bacterium]|nr:hypothetical protein [Blastocatellia bacterium]